MLQLEAQSRPRCGKRRGTSQVTCEVPAHIKHYIHMGRNQAGKWFSWVEAEET